MAALRLHCDVHEGDGPYCLLVHGMLSGRAQWMRNMHALSTVCRPVVVELWGHGRSPSPAGAADYSPEAYVEQFESLRDDLGAERWFVIGQSMGAALTLRYALDRPEVVAAQVFTNSASALADEAWRTRMRATSGATADAIAAQGIEAIEAMPIHPRHAGRLPPDVHAVLVEEATRLAPLGVSMAIRHTVPGSSVRDRFAATTVPTLLVNGAKERGFAEPAAFAKSALPSLEWLDLEAGHAVNIQRAAEFDVAVCDFFRRHRP